MTTTLLVLDTDGDLRCDLERLEEVFLSVGKDNNDPDPGRWAPPLLAIVDAAHASGELDVALRVAEDHLIRMLGPGSYELVPLLRVVAQPGDVETFGAGIAELGRSLLPGGDEVISDMLRFWAGALPTGTLGQTLRAAMWSPRPRRSMRCSRPVTRIGAGS